MIFEGFRRRAGAARARTRGAVDDSSAKRLFAYEMLAVRRNQQDAMLWQSPALALAAEAFLLTIALDSSSSTFARALSAGLGVVVAGMSMQLMAKHRHLAELDNSWLKSMECRLGMDAIAARELDPELEPRRSFFRSLQSYVVWQVGLGLFGLTNFTIVLIALLRPELFAPVG